MNVAIVPIAESHAEGFHACLDAVAREKMYLAQVEALPLERIQGFVRESVAAGAAQFVAIDGPLVVGWCDIFQLGPTPFSTAVRLEWGSCRTIAVGE